MIGPLLDHRDLIGGDGDRGLRIVEISEKGAEPVGRGTRAGTRPAKASGPGRARICRPWRVRVVLLLVSFRREYPDCSASRLSGPSPQNVARRVSDENSSFGDGVDALVSW